MEQKATTTMVVPSEVRIWVTPSQLATFGPGICEVPNELKDHAYLKAHGAKEYDRSAADAIEAKAAASAKVEAEQVLADARTQAAEILAEAKTQAEVMLADAAAEVEKTQALTAAQAEVMLADASGDKKRIKAAAAALAELE